MRGHTFPGSPQYLVSLMNPRAEFSPLGRSTNFSLFKGLVLPSTPVLAMPQVCTSVFFPCHLACRQLAMQGLPTHVIIHFVAQQLIGDFDHELAIILK